MGVMTEALAKAQVNRCETCSESRRGAARGARAWRPATSVPPPTRGGAGREQSWGRRPSRDGRLTRAAGWAWTAGCGQGPGPGHGPAPGPGPGGQRSLAASSCRAPVTRPGPAHDSQASICPMSSPPTPALQSIRRIQTSAQTDKPQRPAPSSQPPRPTRAQRFQPRSPPGARACLQSTTPAPAPEPAGPPAPDAGAPRAPEPASAAGTGPCPGTIVPSARRAPEPGDVPAPPAAPCPGSRGPQAPEPAALSPRPASPGRPGAAPDPEPRRPAPPGGSPSVQRQAAQAVPAGPPEQRPRNRPPPPAGNRAPPARHRTSRKSTAGETPSARPAPAAPGRLCNTLPGRGVLGGRGGPGGGGPGPGVRPPHLLTPRRGRRADVPFWLLLPRVRPTATRDLVVHGLQPGRQRRCPPGPPPTREPGPTSPAAGRRRRLCVGCKNQIARSRAFGPGGGAEYVQPRAARRWPRRGDPGNSNTSPVGFATRREIATVRRSPPFKDQSVAGTTPERRAARRRRRRRHGVCVEAAPPPWRPLHRRSACTCLVRELRAPSRRPAGHDALAIDVPDGRRT